MATEADIDLSRVPRHIAIIMDGNGRWAQARGMQRSAGHVEGVASVHDITEAASDIGVEFLTLYTFSTENWNRPKEEVDSLMELIGIAIERETPGLLAHNVRMTMIGDMERMPAGARSRLEKCFADTAHCTGLTMVLALSYSARWEITRAARMLAREAAAGTLNPEAIDDATVASRLTTATMPDPDLLIRTGGDFRVSNYLLWQIAYSEIYVTPTFWPDFRRPQFFDAIVDYQRRQRRFGLTGEQVQ